VTSLPHDAIAEVLATILVKPKHPLPIIIVGAGGVVRAAHLPAYRKAGYPVAALVDPDIGKAQELAHVFQVPAAAASIEAALTAIQSGPECIFDIAVPAKNLLSVLPLIPDGAAVLIQKPMGETLAEAEEILLLCRAKRLRAAVNFQLRWSPAMLAAEALHKAGLIGDLHDMAIEVNTYMPWELWSFLQTAPRLEILYHSIHYIDLIRAWLGNPRRVYAKTIRNPLTPTLAATKSAIILDYGDWTRALISTNHGQNISPDLQQSYVQWECTEGLLRAQMGVNLDYPQGKPDYLLLARKNTATETIAIEGNWFPDAFIGSMGSLQRFVAGESRELPTSVEDAIDTMRVVEAAYQSSQDGGQELPTLERIGLHDGI
jgi:predicted dehydrogenase